MQDRVLRYGEVEPASTQVKLNNAFEDLSNQIKALDEDVNNLELQRRADKTRITQLEHTVKALQVNVSMLEQDAIDPVTPETGYEDWSNDKLVNYLPVFNRGTIGYDEIKNELLRRLDRVID